MSTTRSAVVSDLLVGSAAGLGATVAMEYAGSWLYEHVEPEPARRKEEQLREAMPTVVMAERLDRRVGGRLGTGRAERLGTWLHFGFGTAWGPVYARLHRRTAVAPMKLGLLLGAGVSLAFDEGLTPAAGLSAPNSAFPWQTHARAFAAHLFFGAAIAAFTEACWRVVPGGGHERTI